MLHGGRVQAPRATRWTRVAPAVVVAAVVAACSGSGSPVGEDAARETRAQPTGPCASVGGFAARPAAQPGDVSAETENGDPIRLLVFSRTEGYRHGSIDDAKALFESLDRDQRIEATLTEDPAVFDGDGLDDFDVVMFANTTGDVLDDGQQRAFLRWVTEGGGFVGVHSAADTEHDWNWYGGLVGAFFVSHPPLLQTARLHTEEPDHRSTAHLPAEWSYTEEYYNFDRDPRRSSVVLLTIEEASAEFVTGGPVGAGFTGGGDHPIAWYHEVGEGRSFYTNLGHSPSTWHDPDFVTHLIEGVRWAAEPGRWRRSVITGDVSSPVALDVAPSGHVVWIQRTGEVRMWDPETGLLHDLGGVDTEVIGEGGLIGLRLAPDVADSGHIFLYWTDPGGRRLVNRLARFTLDSECRIEVSSRDDLLEVPNDRAGHQGGDLQFMPDGTLLVGTGDNTQNMDDGFAPLDGRPGRETRDASRTAADPDDLRGKILRINPDGSTPAGNLFPDGGGRPEIYVMGVRNPYRIAVDPDGGGFWWGDIGPDALADGPRGPRGYDELDHAAAPGDYGWPYCIADNRPYVAYDYATGTIGETFDCDGYETPALAYDYVDLVDPALGRGFRVGSDDGGAGSVELFGRALMAGPFYRPDPDAAFALPYTDVLILHEFARHFLLAADVEDDGSVSRLRRLAPWAGVNTPIDVEAGPDGALYVLENGKWHDASSGVPALTRIEYSRTGGFTELPATRRAPGSASPEAPELDGERLFQLRCAACHGDSGQGGAGPTLQGVTDRLARSELVTIVRDGRSAMPAWEGLLSQEQVEAVVDYLRELPEPPPT